MLFTNRHRIDLPIKYLFFKSLKNNEDMDFCRLLYAKHILLRTRGREPINIFGERSDKQNLEHYFNEAINLFLSMQKIGFDPQKKIPLCANDKSILNGAHRLSCAAALGLSDIFAETIEIETSKKPRPWDFSTYLSSFTPDEQIAIFNGYVEMHNLSTNIAIVYQPAINHIEKIKSILSNFDLEIIADHDFVFRKSERFIFNELIYDIYSDTIVDFDKGMKHIKRKVDYLREYKPSFKLALITSKNLCSDIYKTSTEAKNNIRTQLNYSVPENKYITLHMASSIEERDFIRKTTLNLQNLKYLKLRSNRINSNNIHKWLTGFSCALNDLPFTKESCLIVGSTPLQVLGVRKSTDLDFTLTSKFRQQCFNDGITHLTSTIDVVTKHYSRQYIESLPLSDDILIKNPNYHFYYRGFKFCSPDIVYERKKIQGRSKDRNDVYLMDKKNLKRQKKYMHLIILTLKHWCRLD